MWGSGGRRSQHPFLPSEARTQDAGTWASVLALLPLPCPGTRPLHVLLRHSQAHLPTPPSGHSYTSSRPSTRALRLSRRSGGSLATCCPELSGRRYPRPGRCTGRHLGAAEWVLSLWIEGRRNENSDSLLLTLSAGSQGLVTVFLLFD